MIYFLLISAMLTGMMRGGAQGITITSTSTSSICYNDGTLTLTATGGQAPYTYTITSGPSIPGITYPVSLPAGQNVFSNLASGTYTISVQDALGHTGTTTATVTGSYQFPTMTVDTPTVAGDPDPSLVCIVTGGLPPYQYAISSTGANTGFGPYQASDSFSHLCPGIYWVRVRDACGNIFTVMRHFSYDMLIPIVCSNFSKGILHAGVAGGHAPYTFTFVDNNTGTQTVNTTGIFSNLNPYTTINITVMDSCGVTAFFGEGQRVQRFTTGCPYDGNLYAHIEIGDTLTMTCANCSPVQTVTVNGPVNVLGLDTIFRNVPAGLSPGIVVLTTPGACGIDTLPAIFIPPVVPIIYLSSSSCNSFTAHVSSPVGAVTIDSFVLNTGPGTTTIQWNTTGFFYHLPPAVYVVTAYVQQAAGCRDMLTTTIALPVMNTGCYQLMKDSACQDKWQLSVSPFIPETYSIITPAGDTVGQTPVPAYSDKFFYNITPGTNYTLISDSGCSQTLTPPAVRPQVSEISYIVPCAGLPIVDYKISTSNFCSVSIRLKVFLADTLVHDTVMVRNETAFTVPDSGLYKYKVYIYAATYPSALRYDTICPIDSGSLYVISDHIPYPSPAFANVCDTNGTDSIFYHIVGGFAPYTVQIPGFDTTVLTGNTGIFPSHHPGTYAMIVYDNCGVSRSISFSIIDSCHGCPTVRIAISDTAVCAGDTVYIQSASLNAVAWEWLIDGQAFSGNANTFFIADTSNHDIQLIASAYSGCIDSATVHITVATPYMIDLGVDTSYCDSFSRVLSAGIASAIWSTGVTAAQITVHSPGIYIAAVSDACGVHRDSIQLSSNAIYSLTLTADSTTICSNLPDTAVLTASIDSGSTRPVTFVWSSGQQDTMVYSSVQPVYAAGSYQVTVRRGGCTLSTGITIASVLCDTVCSPCDTTCNTCDTPCIAKIALPDIFTPNGDGRNDTFRIIHTCSVYSFSMQIYDRWGQLMYQSSDIDKGWDGSYRGKPQPSETYTFFICTAMKKGDPVVCRQSTMTLLR